MHATAVRSFKEAKTNWVFGCFGLSREESVRARFMDVSNGFM